MELKLKTYFLLAIIQLVIIETGITQFNANFSASTTQGCAPQPVSFTPDFLNNDAQYSWNFGNGNFSNLPEPTTTYISAGSFTVNLSVTYAGSTVSTSEVLNINDHPVAHFYLSNGAATDCIPFTVSFDDNSYSTGSPITNWVWDFGDGITYSSPTGNNATHNYINTGSFTVSLTVHDNNGCSGSYLKPNYINAAVGPAIGFIASPRQFCIPPGVAQFTSTSSGTPPIYHAWSFGDGQFSNDHNPSHSYNAFGTYAVSLQITDGNGCTKQMTRPAFIIVEDVIASFEMPDTSCSNIPIQFNNTSIGDNQAQWNFTYGTSNQLNPVYSFPVGGMVAVTLTASLDGACPDTYTQSIFVEEIQASFNVSPYPVCTLPLLIDYTNTTQCNSATAINYYWTFQNYGDTNSIDAQVLYKKNLIHFFDYHESYTAILVATSETGCSDVATQTLTWCFPQSKLVCPDDMGCVPFTTSIWDESVFNCPTDYIIEWIWDFGNGTNGSGQFPPPVTFQDTGVFEVVCTLVTNGGCEFEITKMIWVGDMHDPNPIFLPLSNDTICASEVALIGNNAFDPLYIDAHISLGFESDNDINGFIFGYSPNSTIYYNFTDTGWTTLGYAVSHNGCGSVIELSPNPVYVTGVVGLGEAYYSCVAPDTYLFGISSTQQDSFINVDHYYWNFGDGSPIDSGPMPIVHTYPYGASQNYQVTFHTFNDYTECSYTDELFVKPRNPEAVFSMSATDICVGETVFFDPLMSFDYSTISFYWFNGLYKWNFDDGTEFNYIPPYIFPLDTISFGPVSHIFKKAGEFNIRMMVRDVKGCYDTCFHTLFVHEPEPEILAAPPGGCAPLDVVYTNVTPNIGSIASWFWSFGEGTTSTDQDFAGTIHYPAVGNYLVHLHAIDTMGCVNDTQIIVTASLPEADYQIFDTLVCMGVQVQFLNTSSTYSPTPVYTWSFGDGTISNDETPQHAYLQAGIYTVQLHIDDGGCEDSYTRDSLVVVLDSVVSIQPFYDSLSCTPVNVKFNPGFPDFSGLTYQWSINGSPAHLYDPKHYFSSGGPHEIFLNIIGAGCSLTDEMELIFQESNANIFLSDNQICKGEEVLFTINDTFNLGGILIDFADGEVVNNVYSITHQYLNVSPDGDLRPSVYYWNTDSSCRDVDTVTIHILNVESNFERGFDDLDSTACWPQLIDLLGSHVNGHEFEWDFGDGNTSITQNAHYSYENPGDYLVTFWVINNVFDCRVPRSKTVYIYPLPDIVASQNIEICMGDEVQLEVLGGLNYLWSPDEYINMTDVSDPIVSPPVSMDYWVEAISDKECTDSVRVPVFVQQLPEFHQNDSFLVVGQIVDIQDNSSYNVEYFWEPAEHVICPACYNPGFKPLDSTNFYLTMNAFAGDKLCFSVQDSLWLAVYWEFSLELPGIFTPNGDERNDRIYVNGWGIKDLMEFRIYNRWGQEVYYGNDLYEGWDGSYKGLEQPNDTYSYVVKVKTYGGKTSSKYGNFNLIR
jgi:gliding motility-associated-like protein